MRLFLEIGRETGEPELYGVLGNQYRFHRIVEPQLSRRGPRR
ncbi:MAG TPA: hypothetical protein VHQ91_01145 [Geminicoccaceae bacterium]|nr:hypothetical protein [Geminicoccaceae bacterium]